MNYPVNATRLMIVLCLALFSTGCVRPIAGVMHPGADKMAIIKSSSRCANVLLKVDELKRTFCYMSEDESAECYIISTYNFDGILISEKPFPQFSKWCWIDFGYGERFSGSVSPDCSSVAYLDIKDPWDNKEKDLCYFNANTGIRKILVKNLTRKANDISVLCWISDKEVMVAVDAYDDFTNKPAPRLLLIDIEKPTISVDMHCGSLRNSQFAVSHSKRYLAYWEGMGRYSSHGSFHILDLLEHKEVAMTEPGEPATFGGPKWNQEDDALSYIMDNNLTTFSIASKQTTVLKSFANKYDVTLQDYHGQRIYYRITPKDTFDPQSSYVYFDLNTKHEIDIPYQPDQYLRQPFSNRRERNLDFFVCSDGSIIYYIIGQHQLH